MDPGGPLYMVSYVIGILLLIKHLKLEYLDVTQPWYAHDAIVLGIFITLVYILIR